MKITITFTSQEQKQARLAAFFARGLFPAGTVKWEERQKEKEKEKVVCFVGSQLTRVINL